MVRKEDFLLKTKFYVIIFVSLIAVFNCKFMLQDESHMLKDKSAKRTKTATKLAVSSANIE